MSDATRNVILTGFMATGKSTVGRLVAERLDCAFVDTDAVIEERHGPIPQIFATEGEAAFRGYERELGAELATRDGLVVSTGGRMMLDPVVAGALGRSGRVFCLVAAVDTIVDRLDSGPDERPLIAAGDRGAVVRELLAERAAGYGAFEQVDTDGRTPDEIADDIVARLGAG